MVPAITVVINQRGFRLTHPNDMCNPNGRTESQEL